MAQLTQMLFRCMLCLGSFTVTVIVRVVFVAVVFPPATATHTRRP